MNDRHRTKKRYNKKKAAVHRRVNEFLLNDLGRVVAISLNVITDTIREVFKAIGNFATEIKTMPEDEFQKKLAELGSELIPEQLAILEKIRGDGNNGQPNNPTESMGE